MKIEEVEQIRENYRARALSGDERKDRDIWNTSVDISACYTLFMSNPIRNAKYILRIKKKMKKLEALMKGEER